MHPSCSHSVVPTAGLPGGPRQRHQSRCPHPSCSHCVVPTAELPGGLQQRRWRRFPHSSCRRSVAPTAGLPGGLLQLHQRRSPHPSCSHSVAPTAGLPGGLLQRQSCRSSHPNCSHSVAPTAGLPGGHPWLHWRRCSHPNRSRSVAPTAGLPAGLRQLLQSTIFLPMSGTGILHLYPTHGHPKSDQLAARPLAAPAGLPVQRLGGACRGGTCQVWWPITPLHQQPYLSGGSHGDMCMIHGSMSFGACCQPGLPAPSLAPSEARSGRNVF